MSHFFVMCSEIQTVIPTVTGLIVYISFQLWSLVHTGPAGASCVETLRQEGFTGQIVFVCKEPALPYDRVKTSKALDAKLESITFRTASFYKVGVLCWSLIHSVMCQ